MKNDHKPTLSYTNDDDGIHVVCSCGWREKLGFEPTPEAAVKAFGEHMTDATMKAWSKIGGACR